MKPRPKSLVLNVLSTLRGRPVPVRFLVATAELFDIDANATRVAITRLLASGLLERDERGAYRTGQAAAPLQQRLLSWRRIGERMRPWRGDWIGVAPDACCCSKEQRAAALRAVEFLGLRPFAGGLWLRPDNLEGGVAAARDALRSLGLPAGGAVFVVKDFEPADEQRARGLWDRDDIRGWYRRMTVELEASEERLARMPAREAMTECFTLGGDAIRRLVLDPLLPEPIVPRAERDALVAAMIRYDEIGKRIWAPFVVRYGLEETSLHPEASDLPVQVFSAPAETGQRPGAGA